MMGQSSRELQMILEDPIAALAVLSSDLLWPKANQIPLPLPSCNLHNGPRGDEEAVARELTLLVDGSGGWQMASRAFHRQPVNLPQPEND